MPCPFMKGKLQSNVLATFLLLMKISRNLKKYLYFGGYLMSSSRNNDSLKH